ncbi:39039_t:CDS:2 [Gigaspora margarita]|uniref:39039_t:CDS:1 n=1 Tax=Gigaspora margarita TaxID=4874 RepID=A0ABM8VY49_GIGMA|nr:39039_t:CDS:2 [Gigaspora margarita]
MCDLSISKDNHNLKSLSLHYFKDSFNTFLAPEDIPGKAWTFPGLETESFYPNQPNAATFSKPIPITQLKELATRTAKKFAEENQVTEITEHHTHYFYCYLKAYLKAAANNDGIKEIEKYSTEYLPQAEEFIINYYKIAIPDANNNALFFSPRSTKLENTNNETIPPFQ